MFSEDRLLPGCQVGTILPPHYAYTRMLQSWGVGEEKKHKPRQQQQVETSCNKSHYSHRFEIYNIQKCRH